MSIYSPEAITQRPPANEPDGLGTAPFAPDSIIPGSSESWTNFLKNHELTGDREDEVFALSILTSALLKLARNRKGSPSSAFVYDRLSAYVDELATRYLILHPPILHDGNVLQPEDEEIPIPYEDVFVK